MTDNNCSGPGDPSSSWKFIINTVLQVVTILLLVIVIFGIGLIYFEIRAANHSAEQKIESSRKEIINHILR